VYIRTDLMQQVKLHQRHNRMNKLVGPKYFDEIEKAMRKQGFSLFAKVAIDNTDHRYHVTASVARSTGMFFCIPQRALIIQMVYTESDHDDKLDEMYDLSSEKNGVCGHWSITFHRKFLPTKNIYARLIQQGIYFDDWDDALNALPLYRRWPEEIGGLVYLGNSNYDDNHGTNGAIDAGKLAQLIGEPVWKIVDWLDYNFDELQVTSFPPYYTFPGSEETFWKRFDRKKLRGIVHRPWGSDGLKR